jgi:hypothetical protein
MSDSRAPRIEAVAERGLPEGAIEAYWRGINSMGPDFVRQTYLSAHPCEPSRSTG